MTEHILLNWEMHVRLLRNAMLRGVVCYPSSYAQYTDDTETSVSPGIVHVSHPLCVILSSHSSRPQLLLFKNWEVLLFSKCRKRIAHLMRHALVLILQTL